MLNILWLLSSVSSSLFFTFLIAPSSMATNPYAQGGWFNPENPNSINNGPWTPASPPQPSLFGALPYTGAAGDADPTTMRFIFNFNHTVLNSSVVGPRDREYFNIMHNTPNRNNTLFRDAEGRSIAMIDWNGTPKVEIHALLQRQNASSWLALSTDRRQRTMNARGKWYAWVPEGNSVTVSFYDFWRINLD